MQLLVDFLPILAFFVAFKFSDIYIATAVMLAVLVGVVASQWIMHRKVSPMLMVSACVGLVFGGLTIWLHNQLFVQWKPTVLYWLLAATLGIGSLMTDKPLIQRLLGSTLPLPEDAWRTLNTIWVIGFSIIGAINLYVVYNYDVNTWVNFKAWGLTALTFVFALIQGVWMANKLPPDDPAQSQPSTAQDAKPQDGKE